MVKFAIIGAGAVVAAKYGGPFIASKVQAESLLGAHAADVIGAVTGAAAAIALSKVL